MMGRKNQIVNICPFFDLMENSRVQDLSVTSSRDNLLNSKIIKRANEELKDQSVTDPYGSKTKRYQCKVFKYRRTPSFLDYNHIMQNFLNKLCHGASLMRF